MPTFGKCFLALDCVLKLQPSDAEKDKEFPSVTLSNVVLLLCRAVSMFVIINTYHFNACTMHLLLFLLQQTNAQLIAEQYLFM